MNKPLLTKTLLSIALVAIVGFGYGFAQETTPVTEAQQTVTDAAQRINIFVSILSWAWIVFANIAGKLLTNSRIYADGIGMDRYLRLLRNMVRNISNYILGFLFLFFLFKTMFYQEEAANVIKGIVVNILIAGIAIQASRFIVAATLDISTIATAAVGALPAQLIATQNQGFVDGIKNGGMLDMLKASPGGDRKIDKKLMITLFPEDGNTLVTHTTELLEEPITQENFMDMLLPKPDQVAGPLVYIGASIIETNKLDPVDITQPVSALMKILIDGFGIIFYGIAMILLAIVAFIRIVYLWIFIVLSPLVLLISCLEIGKDNKIPGLQSISKALKDVGLSFGSFLSLAFKPVLMVLAIVAMFVFSVLMKNVIVNKPTFQVIQGTTIESVEMQSNNSTKKVEYQTSIDSGSYQVVLRGMSKGLAQLLLTLLTIVFMRFILKIALTSHKTGIDLIDKKILGDQGLLNWVQKTAGDIPLVPLPTGKGVGFNAIAGHGGLVDQIGKKVTSTLITQHSDANRQAVENAVNQVLGNTGNRGNLYGKEIETLRDAANDRINPGKFITDTKTFNADRNVGVSDANWTTHFITWLNMNNGTNEMQKLWKQLSKSGKKDEENLEELFNNNTFRNTYRSSFGGTSATRPTTYAEAKTRKYFY